MSIAQWYSSTECTLSAQEAARSSAQPRLTDQIQIISLSLYSLCPALLYTVTASHSTTACRLQHTHTWQQQRRRRRPIAVCLNP